MCLVYINSQDFSAISQHRSVIGLVVVIVIFLHAMVSGQVNYLHRDVSCLNHCPRFFCDIQAWIRVIGLVVVIVIFLLAMVSQGRLITY